MKRLCQQCQDMETKAGSAYVAQTLMYQSEIDHTDRAS
jgi:hypothetical protein